MTRRDHGSGSIYRRHDHKTCPPLDPETGQRAKHKCRGRWVATVETGWTSSGTRRRVTLTAKTEAEVKRKVRDKRAALERGENAVGRMTVKRWSEIWLPMKATELRPKAYNAVRGPLHEWIVPVIGHRRLSDLTPADVRNVTKAVRDAGRKGSTAAAVQRTLFNMLRGAILEGHTVPERVLLTKAPTTAKSDRMAPTVAETIAALQVAATLPHGMRWVFALVHGMRKAEVLGATWDQLDLDAGVYHVQWQLQRLPYRDPKNKAAGFRLPDNLEVRHLYRAWHLTEAKTKAGEREHPLLESEVDALRRWRAIAPENPWGLIFPSIHGKPATEADDLEEWHAIQCTAGIGHPGGRYYHVHECRNLAATQLRESGADDLTIMSLLGHTQITTSHAYMRVDLAAKRDALTRVAGAIGWTGQD